MKTLLSIIVFSFSMFLFSCSNGQTTVAKKTIAAIEFSDKIKEIPTGIVIDVRSPEEFAGGHISGAKNFNWNGTDFEKQISTIDKSKAVFLYCHIGGRSSAAAKKMIALGFENVYELKNGIVGWREAKMPEVK